MCCCAVHSIDVYRCFIYLLFFTRYFVCDFFPISDTISLKYTIPLNGICGSNSSGGKNRLKSETKRNESSINAHCTRAHIRQTHGHGQWAYIHERTCTHPMHAVTVYRYPSPIAHWLWARVERRNNAAAIVPYKHSASIYDYILTAWYSSSSSIAQKRCREEEMKEKKFA